MLPIYKANNRPRVRVGTRVGLQYGEFVQEGEVIEDLGDLRDDEQFVLVQWVEEGDLVTPEEVMVSMRRVSELVPPPDTGVAVQRVPQVRRARGRRRPAPA
jgi:hypothetical protein